MEEERLIKRAAGGDNAAFEELAGIYQQRIYAVCLRVLRADTDAQDASQEALLKIYLNLKKFKFNSRFSTWAYTISRNCALDILRKKKADISIDEYCESGFDIPDISLAPEAEAESGELRSAITRLINTLGEEQRKCLILKDVDGYSLEETAEILGIPEGTVKSRIHRGREKLRELMAAEGV